MAELLGCLWFNQPPAEFRRADEPARSRNLSPSSLHQGSPHHFDVADGHGAARVRSVRLLNMPSLNRLDAFSMEQGQQMFASQEGTSVWCLCNRRWTWAVTARVRVAEIHRVHRRRLKAEQKEEWDGVGCATRAGRCS